MPNFGDLNVSIIQNYQVREYETILFLNTLKNLTVI